MSTKICGICEKEFELPSIGWIWSAETGYLCSRHEIEIEESHLRSKIKVSSKTRQQLDEMVKHFKYQSLEDLICAITDIAYKKYKDETDFEKKLTFEALNSIRKNIYD